MLKDRKGISSRLEYAMFSLKNSVMKHRKGTDLDALKNHCTVDELKQQIEELLKLYLLEVNFNQR